MKLNQYLIDMYVITHTARISYGSAGKISGEYFEQIFGGIPEVIIRGITGRNPQSIPEGIP